MGGIVGTLVGGVVIGLIFGSLARLILPGEQDISLVMTIVFGFVGALLGGFLAELVGVRETEGIDWIKLVLQIGGAVLVIWGYGALRARSTSQ